MELIIVLVRNINLYDTVSLLSEVSTDHQAISDVPRYSRQDAVDLT